MQPESMEIDDSLYSRQRYMLGDQAMKKMASSSVILFGCDCLGVEIAKNLVLTGVGNLVISDSKLTTTKDVSTNFYITEADVNAGKTRAEACVPKLSELNPYVNISVSTDDVSVTKAIVGDLSLYPQLQEEVEKQRCVISTQQDLRCQFLLNEFCRRSKTGTKFISCSVLGVFSQIFCDFGRDFEVVDTTGETLKEVFVDTITKANPGVVTCVDNKQHGLEDGDLVTFKGIEGMLELNEQVREVKILSSTTFTIEDTSALSIYTGGGIVKQVHKKVSFSHKPMDDNLDNPSIVMADLGKMDNPLITHIAWLALANLSGNGAYPSTFNDHTVQALITFYKKIAGEFDFDVDSEISQKIIRTLAYTWKSVLPPLAAAMGGIAAQEALKSLTGKYAPLKQWLYIDALELVGELPSVPNDTTLSDIETCIGKQISENLQKLNVFMVGCGAIGCEMLKNLALLGVATKDGGKLSITDNDVIEKSNLNRQFLFRNRHVGQLKSSVAASSAKGINPAINIHSMQHKVGPDTEQSVFTNNFFESQDIAINALDNVQARRYMDGRCVMNQIPLLESGTMGPKGHVQVIVPFVTESYSNQQDPADVQYPFCTLKSFPSQIEHTLQWARDKFEVMFTQKPMTFNKFWGECRKDGQIDNAAESFAKHLTSGGSVQDAIIVVKILSNVPQNWMECVQIARCKFEKYFNHKARNLIRAFPLDTKLADGSPFWSLPKRPPTPLVFDQNEALHMGFVTSLACLIARIHKVQHPTDETEFKNSIITAIQNTKVPAFVGSNKEIVTDENASTPETDPGDDVDKDSLCEKVSSITASQSKALLEMTAEDFEKDDDSNHHIDFISSAANLRAAMYGIECVDRLEAKRIAGRIIPAICTTTSAVAGFVTIQFIQLVSQMVKNRAEHGKSWISIPERSRVDAELSKYRNCFLNLALPVVIFSEPAAAERTVLPGDVTFTNWDRWEVHGSQDYRLKDLVQHFQSKLKLQISAIVQGSRMVYIPIMPGHTKRLNQLMTKLVKVEPNDPYVDLTATFENEGGEEDYSCPPIRYYFS